jgi:hypothetical protein
MTTKTNRGVVVTGASSGRLTLSRPRTDRGGYWPLGCLTSQTRRVPSSWDAP